MEVTSLAKQKAVSALHAEARARLFEGRSTQARQKASQAQTLQNAPGADLQDIFSKAETRSRRWTPVSEFLAPFCETPSERGRAFETTYRCGWSVALATSGACFLAGRGFEFSMGMGISLFTANAFVAFCAMAPLTQRLGRSYHRGAVLSLLSLATGTTIGLAAQNLGAGAGIGAATGIAILALTQASKVLASKSHRVLEAVEGCTQDLDESRPSTQTIPNLPRTEVLWALGEFAGESHSDLAQALSRLPGQDFDQLYAASLAKPRVADQFERAIPAILDAAQKRREVADLHHCDAGGVEVSMDEEYVQIGDVLLARSEA